MGFKLPSNIDLALTGLAGVGGIFANRAGKSTQTSSQTTQLTPEQIALLSSLNGQYTNLNTDPDLSGYEAGQVSDINHQSNLHMQALQENLAYRGITGAAEANAEANVDSQRFGDITKLHQSIPLLRNQIQTQNLNTGIGLFGAQPRNVSTSTTGTTSANKLGGGISNAANVLAYLYGKGAFSPTPAAPTAQPKAQSKSSGGFNPFGGISIPPAWSPISRTPSYVGG